MTAPHDLREAPGVYWCSTSSRCVVTVAGDAGKLLTLANVAGVLIGLLVCGLAHAWRWL